MATHSLAWQQLQQHFSAMSSFNMAEAFAADPKRASHFSLDACGFTLDYSKNLITDDTLQHLLALAEEQKLEAKRDAMFNGEIINHTEGRAVLHTALRNSGKGPVLVDGNNVLDEVHAAQAQMKAFVEKINNGQWQGARGKTITDIISIGIGGSYLGPKIMTEALKPFWQNKVKVHFVANVDGHHIDDVLRKLNADTTLVLTSSKSFSTQETLVNTEAARNWLLASGLVFNDLQHHIAAVSSNIKAATEFGIAEQNIFPMWDWVGGRYSLWSAIGLPIAVAIGWDNFAALLSGAESMDTHFREAPLAENMPVLMAMLGVWYHNFYGSQSHVLLPYYHYLRGFPAYVQQLDMESNGKSTTQNGESVADQTGPIIWGGEGTNGQHAFHQLMHQGTRLIPADFIMPLTVTHELTHQHQMLAANCFAQTQALMVGKTLAQAEQELADSGKSDTEIAALAQHKVMPGNRPSNTLICEQFTPFEVGALVALYEHKVFVQGVIWDVNSFDQWGVELGKVLGNQVLEAIQNPEQALDGFDASTAQLIMRMRQGS